MEIYQLNLLENTLNVTGGESVDLRNYLQRSIKHGVTINSTARGSYYCYWWNYVWRSVEGVERIRTQKKPIRGARIGTEKAEDLRVLVESWIASGLLPRQICLRLELLPRSYRRSRHSDWADLN